jgi:lactoylglutathione lyase
VLKRLSHVCLGSTNLSRTVTFYRDLLGCEVAHEFRNPEGKLYGVFLACRNGTFLEFFNEDRPPPAGGLFRHLCFEVEDIERLAERVRGRGLEAEVRRGRTDHILQFFISDPDGNRVEFQQHDRQSVLYSRLPENG